MLLLASDWPLTSCCKMPPVLRVFLKRIENGWSCALCAFPRPACHLTTRCDRSNYLTRTILCSTFQIRSLTRRHPLKDEIQLSIKHYRTYSIVYLELPQSAVCNEMSAEDIKQQVFLLLRSGVCAYLTGLVHTTSCTIQRI